MPVYIGPDQVTITRAAVPTNIVAATVATFIANSSTTVFNSAAGGPYQLQIIRNIAVFSGNYSPSPAPPNPIPDIPAAADPPFPPVWPYPFSSDVLYGRDGVGVINVLVRKNTYEMLLTAISDSSDNALDLTGCTLEMVCKFNVADDDADALFELSTTGGGIVITSAVDGEFSVTIPAVATEDVPLIKTILFYDILYSLGSTRFTVLRGQLVCLPNISGDV